MARPGVSSLPRASPWRCRASSSISACSRAPVSSTPRRRAGCAPASLEPLALAAVEQWIIERRCATEARYDRLAHFLDAQDKENEEAVHDKFVIERRFKQGPARACSLRQRGEGKARWFSGPTRAGKWSIAISTSGSAAPSIWKARAERHGHPLRLFLSRHRAGQAHRLCLSHEAERQADLGLLARSSCCPMATALACSIPSTASIWTAMRTMDPPTGSASSTTSWERRCPIDGFCCVTAGIRRGTLFLPHFTQREHGARPFPGFRRTDMPVTARPAAFAPALLLAATACFASAPTRPPPMHPKRPPRVCSSASLPRAMYPGAAAGVGMEGGERSSPARLPIRAAKIQDRGAVAPRRRQRVGLYALALARSRGHGKVLHRLEAT